MANAPSSSPPHVPVPVSIIETYSLISDTSANENGSSSSPSSASPRLSAFVVRLTDASLKALNQAVAEARQKKGKGNPSCGYVELGNRGSFTEGTLCFGGSSSVVHRFSLADAQRDLGPKGQLDVVEQQRAADSGRPAFTKSSTCGTMKSIGPVTQRVQISATTEDTFEKTKQKAQQANEEMKRTAAKVALKGPAGAGGATKVWQKINNAKASTSQRPITPLSHQHQKAQVHNKPAPSGNAGSNGGAGDISKRPLRQRILYKLLPNPMTAVDLLGKLSSEGLTDHERSLFDRTLNEVAQISRPPDSTSGGGVDALCLYELKRSSYSDIRLEEWPFYNNWERQQCRKKLLTYRNPAMQQHSNTGSSSNGTSYNNQDDTTRRVSGKISYRPPPKKPAANDSPKMVPSSTVSPPMPPTAPSLSSPPSSTASPTPVATSNGSAPHNHPDDTTQRVSAKISYKPPVKKPAASPSIGVTGKSPPTAPAPLPSPPRPASTTTSPTPTTAMNSAYSPPPKKKAHKDNNDVASNGVNPNSPVGRSAPVHTSNGHEFEDDTNLRRKRRQQHQQRPALTTSNNHGNMNGHANTHAAPAPAPAPPPPSDPLDDSNCWTNPHPAAVDYRNEYPAISTADDRRRYKDDFDREYPTYLKLYERLRLTASEFEKLGEKLKRTNKETPEYKDIEREIFTKYRQFQQDTDMHHSRREHERLRRKLGLIKERVKEYDDRQLVLPMVNGISDW